MADYPTSIPVLIDEVGSASDPLSDPSMPAWALHISQEVEAIAGELGIAPSGAAATVLARLDTLDTTVAGKAVDADVVHDTGAETVAGVKTFSSDPIIPDEVYDATAWNGVLEPPTKNAVRDKIEDILDGVTFTGDVVVPDEAYGAGWNGSLEVPTKNAVYDKIETLGGAAAEIGIAVGDETTAITTGTAKVTFRMPFAMTLTAVRASLTTASSSGIPTFDINEAGTTILSTKLTIDANEKTSTTAATAAVISDSALADDAEITIDIDVAGTGAAGPKIWLIGTRV